MKSTGMWRRDGKLVICGWHAWALKIRQAQIQQFKSDFRVVAEFCSQKRKQLDYTPSNQQLQHAKEVLQLFSIMTDDARFEDIYNEELLECLQDGDILVLTPEYTNTQVVYGGETGVETAKALALQAYEEELFTRRSAQAEEERVQESDEAAAEEEEKITKKAEEEEGAEEVEEAEKAGVEALGYESLEQMRRYNHTVYDIEKAYFVKLTGYWYPEKDRNSRTYLVVDEQDVMRWFTFQEGKGDVETAFQRVSSAKGNHYRLSDGRSFTMKESMRENTLQFDGEETVYYWDGY